MTRKSLAFTLASLSLAAIAACDGFQLNINFTVPRRAADSSSALFDMPAGARLVVRNAVGSTRVSVDPAATQARVEVERAALADTQEEADALLALIMVNITAPTVDANELVIDAPKPAEATDDDSSFSVNTDDNGTTVVSINASVKVAEVQLRIILPPGHACDLTQTAGSIRVVALDTDSTLTTRSGSIRSIGSACLLVITSQTGSVKIEAHSGGVDVEGRTGSVEIESIDIISTESIIVRLETGSIELALPSNVDADVTAIAESGSIDFRRRDFDDTNGLTETRSTLTVQLNDGGALIDLRTESGHIDFDSF